MTTIKCDPPYDPYAWVCLCGNTPSTGGFYPCDLTGSEVEPTQYGPWDGIHYVCADCGRIIDQNTRAVVAPASDDLNVCPNGHGRQAVIEGGTTPGFTGAPIDWYTLKCGCQIVDADADTIEHVR